MYGDDRLQEANERHDPEYVARGDGNGGAEDWLEEGTGGK